jgi:hypothetical protein
MPRQRTEIRSIRLVLSLHGGATPTARSRTDGLGFSLILPDQFARTSRRLRAADRKWYERPTTRILRLRKLTDTKDNECQVPKRTERLEQRPKGVWGSSVFLRRTTTWNFDLRLPTCIHSHHRAMLYSRSLVLYRTKVERLKPCA